MVVVISGVRLMLLATLSENGAGSAVSLHGKNGPHFLFAVQTIRLPLHGYGGPCDCPWQSSIATMSLNISLGTETQLKEAASPLVLRSGQLRHKP